MRTTTALLIVAALGCGGSFPSVPPSRALCYAAADLRAQERFDRECRIGDAGVPFSECPAAPAIDAQLRQEQEACP